MKFTSYIVFSLFIFTIGVSARSFLRLSLSPPALSALSEAGRAELAAISTDTSFTCSSRALQVMQRDCDAILSDDGAKRRLALLLADCFRVVNSLPRFPCMGSPSAAPASVDACVRQLATDHALLSSYEAYYRHVDSVCYYLQADLWRRRTDDVVDRLRNSAESVTEQLIDVNNTVKTSAKTVEATAAAAAEARLAVDGLASSVEKQAQEAAAAAAEVNSSLGEAVSTLLTLEKAQKGTKEAVSKLGAGVNNISQQTDAILTLGNDTRETVLDIANLAQQHKEALDIVSQTAEKLLTLQKQLQVGVEAAAAAAAAASHEAENTRQAIAEVAAEQAAALAGAQAAEEAAQAAAAAAEGARKAAVATGRAAQGAVDELLGTIRNTADKLAAGNERIERTQAFVLRALDSVQRRPKRSLLLAAAMSALGYVLLPFMRIYAPVSIISLICMYFIQFFVSTKLPHINLENSLFSAYFYTLLVIVVGDIIHIPLFRTVVSALSRRSEPPAPKKTPEITFDIVPPRPGAEWVFDE